MKQVFVLLIPAFLLMACNRAEKAAGPDPMNGVYQMTSQSFKGDQIDTTLTSNQQLKIFNGDFLMYTRYNPADSNSAFGIGTYQVSGDTVTENIMFTASDTLMTDSPRSYRLLVEKSVVGYNQIIPRIEDANGTYQLTEKYDSKGADVSCPLDGVWKLAKEYYLENGDTMLVEGTQYKLYHQGYFVWGRTYTDSLGRRHTGIGWGRYTPEGEGKLKESVLSSTFPDTREQDFAIEYKLLGPDGYQQSLTNSNGVRTTEIYERVKKTD
jgi:hypothetical protein